MAATARKADDRERAAQRAFVQASASEAERARLIDAFREDPSLAAVLRDRLAPLDQNVSADDLVGLLVGPGAGAPALGLDPAGSPGKTESEPGAPAGTGRRSTLAAGARAC